MTNQFDYKAPPLITTQDDPRRNDDEMGLQFVQGLVYSFQRRYSAETLAFRALRLAWEAIRLAWYAVRDETDGDHLPDVRAALRVVEEHLGAKPGTASLPFVSDELLVQMGDSRFDLKEAWQHMRESNPHLLEYIYGFPKYIETEGEFTQDNVFGFGLSIYEALRRAGDNEEGQR